MIDELVAKKTETARKRAEMLAAAGGAVITPEMQRNEVKISQLTKKGRTSNGKVVINGYVLVHQLGKGSYGTVHLGMSLAHSKKYAIKIVSRALLRKKRFGASANKSDEEVLREVAVMKRLQHRNVVALIEVIDDPAGDKFYLVQEYMDLGPVMTEAEYNAPLKPDVARKYFRDVLCGLEYLHFQGVVHRDIKPSNILISSDGTAKLADFGAAALTSADGTDYLTEVKGTPAFQPPEVFLLESGQRYSGFAVDIWAVGATLHCMVVGTPPYLAENELALVEKLKHEDFRLSTAVQLDPHLRNLLQRCLTKDAERRITLREIMNHEWVTEEGVHPLITRPYVKLDLAGTAVVSASGEFGKPGLPTIPASADNRHPATSGGSSSSSSSDSDAGNGRSVRRNDKMNVARGSRPALAAASPGSLAAGSRGKPQRGRRRSSSSSSSSSEDSEAARARLAAAAAKPKFKPRFDHTVAYTALKRGDSSAALPTDPPTLASAAGNAPSQGQASTAPMLGRTGAEPAAVVAASTASAARSSASSAAGPLAVAAVGGAPQQHGPGLPTRPSFYRASESMQNSVRMPADDQTEDQKAHLRTLRMRQHNLLSGHTSLTERDIDTLADQKRIAFHRARATAQVHELHMDRSGQFTDAPSSLDGNSTQGRTASGPLGSMSSVPPSFRIPRRGRRGSVGTTASAYSEAVRVDSQTAFATDGDGVTPGVAHPPMRPRLVAEASVQSSMSDVFASPVRRVGPNMSQLDLIADGSPMAASVGIASSVDTRSSGISLGIRDGQPRTTASLSPGSGSPVKSSGASGPTAHQLASPPRPGGGRRRSSGGSQASAGSAGVPRGGNRFASTDSQTGDEAHLSSNGPGAVAVAAARSPRAAPGTSLAGASSEDGSAGDAGTTAEAGGSSQRRSLPGLDSQHTMASSMSGFSSSSSRAILSHAASQQKLSAGLGRKGDFVMVTANVDAAADGGTVMRKVVFSAKGREGTLSITGGRAFGGTSKLRRKNSHKRERELGAPGDDSDGDNEDAEAGSRSHRSGENAPDGFGGMATVSEEGSDSSSTSSGAGGIGGGRARRRAGKRRAGRAHASGNSNNVGGGIATAGSGGGAGPAGARADSAAGSTSASATGTDTETPSDDDDYAGVTTLDDMTGTALAPSLGDALADLTAAPQHGADDEELLPLTLEEEREWQKQRSRGFITAWPAGTPVTPADVAQELAADIQASAAAKSSRGLLGLRATRSATAPSAASSSSSDEDDSEGAESVAGSSGDEDWGLSKPVKRKPALAERAGPGGGSPGGIGNAQAGGAPVNDGQPVVPPDAWNSCRSGETFVSCPLGANPALRVVYGEAHSRGLRATMEDRCVAIADLNAACDPQRATLHGPGASSQGSPLYAFFAVYDGHNGTGTCDALAQGMHFELAQRLRLLPAGTTVAASAGAGGVLARTDSPAAEAGSAEFAAFARACADMDQRLVASVQPGEPISGSTAVMLLVRKAEGDAVPTLFCANVGDSRAVICRGGNKLDLSFDHKVTRPDERARIQAAGGSIIKDRLNGVLAVSRAFGDAEHKRASGIEWWNRELTADPLSAEPEVTHEPVHPQDEFLVLACDGVFDVMTSQQVVNFVRRRLLVHRDVRRAAAELVEKAVALHTIDNVSAIVVAFSPA